MGREKMGGARMRGPRRPWLDPRLFRSWIKQQFCGKVNKKSVVTDNDDDRRREREKANKKTI